MAHKATTLIGLAWYRAEDYPVLRAMFADGRKLQATYQEWVEEAQRTYTFLIGEGFHVIKISIDPDLFPAWCAKRGIAMDADARSRYAQEFVATYDLLAPDK